MRGGPRTHRTAPSSRATKNAGPATREERYIPDPDLKRQTLTTKQGLLSYRRRFDDGDARDRVGAWEGEGGGYIPKSVIT